MVAGQPRTRRALILSGGVAHDFEATSSALTDVLAEVGFDAATSEDVDRELAALAVGGPDLVVLNLLRWTMKVERYAAQRERWSISLSEDARAGLRGYVEAGGGLLGMHGASICFDDWPGWWDLLGAVWRWETSFHPPLDGPVPVEVTPGAQHPVVAGVSDFEVVDEAYGFLDVVDDVEPLLSTRHSGATHPLLWARPVGAGRVVYDALGHDVRSFSVPEHRQVVQQAVRWAARRP